MISSFCSTFSVGLSVHYMYQLAVISLFVFFYFIPETRKREKKFSSMEIFFFGTTISLLIQNFTIFFHDS
jgi:hypothetical protein